MKRQHKVLWKVDFTNSLDKRAVVGAVVSLWVQGNSQGKGLRRSLSHTPADWEGWKSIESCPAGSVAEPRSRANLRVFAAFDSPLNQSFGVNIVKSSGWNCVYSTARHILANLGAMPQPLNVRRFFCSARKTEFNTNWPTTQIVIMQNGIQLWPLGPRWGMCPNLRYRFPRSLCAPLKLWPWIRRCDGIRHCLYTTSTAGGGVTVHVITLVFYIVFENRGDNLPSTSKKTRQMLKIDLTNIIHLTISPSALLLIPEYM